MIIEISKEEEELARKMSKLRELLIHADDEIYFAVWKPKNV